MTKSWQQKILAAILNLCKYGCFYFYNNIINRSRIPINICLDTKIRILVSLEAKIWRKLISRESRFPLMQFNASCKRCENLNVRPNLFHVNLRFLIIDMFRLKKNVVSPWYDVMPFDQLYIFKKMITKSQKRKFKILAAIFILCQNGCFDGRKNIINRLRIPINICLDTKIMILAPLEAKI